MQHNKSKTLLLILMILIASVISLIVFLIYHCVSNKETNYYGENIKKVVEIVAYDEESNKSYGTGWFIDEKKIVTNYHVISYSQIDERIQFDTIEIRFYDEEDYERVYLLNFDETEDIAVLSYQNVNNHSTFATELNFKTGDNCYSIGNFQNYGLSYKEGFISLKSVNLKYNNVYREFIQCSIGIGQGDSGAPLFNEKNEVIGMITFRTKNSLGNVEQIFAYAIPASRIVDLI